MSMTILVPLDGSHLAELALPYALDLVRAAGGRLILFHASATRGQGDQELEVAADLDRLADGLRQDGIAATTLLSHDPAAEAIVQAARDQHATMIVMATHGRGGIGRALYGSVADQVLRAAPVPVFLVTPTGERWWPVDRPLRILVPLDGSDLATEALKVARELSGLVSGELVLIMALAPAYSFTAAGFPFRQPVSEAERQKARAYLEQVAKQLELTPVDLRVESDEPAAAIAKAARELPADLIVMSTHGRGGLARLVLGSVATGVLHRARVPVLLVKPAAVRSTSGEVQAALP